MPFPPPPAVALIMTGYPTFSAAASPSSTVGRISVPGVIGTLAAETVLRAVALSPIRSMITLWGR